MEHREPPDSAMRELSSTSRWCLEEKDRAFGCRVRQLDLNSSQVLGTRVDLVLFLHNVEAFIVPGKRGHETEAFIVIKMVNDLETRSG